jgi:hypothetical protein
LRRYHSGGDTDRPNQNANKEPAEGSRENTNVQGGGITNRPLEEERREQQELPPRGSSKQD